jgi:hypothetical protein
MGMCIWMIRIVKRHSIYVLCLKMTLPFFIDVKSDKLMHGRHSGFKKTMFPLIQNIHKIKYKWQCFHLMNIEIQHAERQSLQIIWCHRMQFIYNDIISMNQENTSKSLWVDVWAILTSSSNDLPTCNVIFILKGHRHNNAILFYLYSFSLGYF